jgi:CBS domain-containing protein
VSQATAADRFLTAWKRLEAEISSRWRASHKGTRDPDAVAMLGWAEKEHLLSGETARFLHSCRVARNAYSHVSFEGYDGPVTLPPLEVVHRLERILASVLHPAGLSSVGARAVTCTPSCTLRNALALMREHDFSQLPYRHDELGWILVTREQVSRWLEAETDADGTALTDLMMSVSTLADRPDVGPVLPRLLGSDATLAEALKELEGALHTPDSKPGGYAVVLISPKEASAAPWILASDDLPHLYDLLLGR